MACTKKETPKIDKGLIQSAIGKTNEIQLVQEIKLELRSDKIDLRLLVLSSFRFYILHANKSPYKVDHSVHILDINGIESKKPDQIVIKYGEKSIKFCLVKPQSTHITIGHIVANLKLNFPGANLGDTIKKEIEPSDKLESVNNMVEKITSSESLAETGPCGGFSRSYACICDHLAVPFIEEVAWDVDTIYLSNDTKEFNVQDFDHWEQRDLIPIIATLEYNAWFTKFVCVSCKLSTEILEAIAKVVKRSTTLVELRLDSIGLGREFCQKLTTALTSNPKSALERIDLSSNPSVEDRGITHLVGGISKLSHGLDSLNLHDTGLTNKGIISVGQMLKSNKFMSTSLTSLNLSNNQIKAEGVTVLCEFLAQCNDLTHLDLSSTECYIESIFGALIRGCCQNLTHLNFSGNHFTNRRSKDGNLSSSFQQFFSATAALKEVKLSKCSLPAEAVKAMFLGLMENSVVTDVTVDISKNELKTAGLREMKGPLREIKNLYSLDLTDNGFDADLLPLCESLSENKRLKRLYLGMNCHKSRSQVMEALTYLVENSAIEFLSLSESKLKHDIAYLFNSLGTNEYLIELDITGNMMGDEGARVLAKALQINSKLRTIHLDRNGITQNGFRDIAMALENNLTLQFMPTPVNDVSLCLKPATEKALKQIEKCLSRNYSPSHAVTEQAYRLQQGLMMTSTQQQMIDKLIVQLQDTLKALGASAANETVKLETRNARRLINDADKLKQLLLKLHMSGSSSDLKERVASLSSDIHNAIQKQLKENVEKILNCAEESCPLVTKQTDVKENLKSSIEGKANINKAFVDSVFLQQLAPIILNEVSEKSLSMSIVMVDTLMDHAIQQLEEQQVKLNLLLEQQDQVSKEKLTVNEDDHVSEAAQKAKNRLSTVNNRIGLRVPEDNNDMSAGSVHSRRRPTINRRHVTSDELSHIAKDHTDDASQKEDDVFPVGDIDILIPANENTQELVHVTKNRARPARGRRPPTRASAAQNNSVVGPEIVSANVDEGVDTFFKEPAIRPVSAVLPSKKTVPEPMPPKSSTLKSPKEKKKMETTKEEIEDVNKDQDKKKSTFSLSSIFKKKKDENKPKTSRKESKKEIRKSVEDLTEPSRSPPEKKPVKKPPQRPQKPSKPAGTEKHTKVDEQSESEKHGEGKKEAEIEAKTEVSTAHDKNDGDESKLDEKEDKSTEDMVEKANVQPKGPPRYGVGLPMGGVDLIAEMKEKRANSIGKGKTSPEEGQRRATVGAGQRPNVPARPSTKPKHLVTVKSDSSAGAKVNGKPLPQPKTKEDSSDTTGRMKPPIKGKPSVTKKPALPRRPPSISRNRPNSQKDGAKKQESLEIEKHEEKIVEETSKISDSKKEVEKKEESTEIPKIDAEEEKESKETRKEEKIQSDVPEETSHKGEDEKPMVEDDGQSDQISVESQNKSSEETSIKSCLEELDQKLSEDAQENSNDSGKEVAEESKNIADVAGKDTTDGTGNETMPEGGKDLESSVTNISKSDLQNELCESAGENEDSEIEGDKLKDRNDNVSAGKDNATETDTTAVDDDVIKSPVDEELLEDAARDTSL
ncbi:F-actin-uncapping protein LRRC16A-like [Xenia sp. Carnegie-2017]|uniref:F-actin-uncapping protein LRRC16A-like n=1 Tax=Xenia sp. Carnegie-2017 TaxID=2897299 RepID=UPI001F0497FC|nr:F-actin-uncapping protein LRRC16A-like [Xenia sp. Carnegie-2017]